MRPLHLFVLLAAALVTAPAAAETLETFRGRLFLPVEVNGTRTIALLDSGAEMSVLDDDFAHRLGLSGSGSAVARGSGAETMEARFVDRVTLAAIGIAFAPRAAIIDLGEVSQRLIGRPVDLILGRDLFDRVRLRIDIQSGSIEALGVGAPARGTRLAVGEHRGTPTIAASVEGQPPVQAVFDLGNGSLVLIGRAYAERIGLAAPDRIVGRRSGGGLGGALDRDRIMLRSLVVAGREYRDVPAAIDASESASDLNIGTSILKDFVITTDFAERAIWLEGRP